LSAEGVVGVSCRPVAEDEVFIIVDPREGMKKLSHFRKS
jgi:hypothetical protein